MADSAMSRVITVRIEDELANLLNSLNNRSEFIRAAILAQCVVKCPLCAGIGSVPPGIASTIAPIIWSSAEIACTKCGFRECIQ